MVVTGSEVMLFNEIFRENYVCMCLELCYVVSAEIIPH